MNTRIVLFLMTILVAAVCTSCATRQTGPAEPETPSAPTEPETPSAPTEPEVDEPEPFTKTVSALGDDVQVAHQVPTGWTVNLEEGDDMVIRMTHPTGAASFRLFLTMESVVHTSEQAMALTVLFWYTEEQHDPNLRIEAPEMEVIQGIDVWSMSIRTLAPVGEKQVPVTITNIILTSNDPDWVITGRGAWATKEDAHYRMLFGQVVGNAVVMTGD
ncbi:MAG: hypothetical protein U9Q03_03445 [Patescibacteria group bacterium]|nr:hypothetical protein [Patescibacteria group bacterium]